MAASTPCTDSSDGGALRPILCVGLVCLDIVNLCEGYPKEDEDVRAKEQQWRSGGNAGNSSIVLSVIGRRSEFLGTLGRGMETEFAVSQLDKHGISHEHCIHHNDCTLPTSYIILNTLNGSRTIVHYRNLPELLAEDFSKIDLSQYSWIHFEGRSPDSYSQMIEHVVSYRTQNESCGGEGGGEDGGEEGRQPLGVSVELEKQRPELVRLAPLADVLLLSREFSQFRGYRTMEEAALGFRGLAKKDAVVVCAWGDKGAAATDSNGKLYTCPAYPPPRLVDTLGAGDTFNAGLLHKLSTGHPVEAALLFACQLAGAKCGMLGFEGLAEHFRNL